MKTKFKTVNSFFLVPMLIQNQDFLSTIKNFINNNLIGLFLITLGLSAFVGVIYNLDNLIDREGKGTRSKALVDLGWIIGIAFISVLAIVALFNFLRSSNVTV